MVDTRLFSESFKDRLLALTHDLASGVGGLLVDSENFQALTLMQAQYRDQIDCVYVDPPYNTDTSAIIYKNDYKHSSWLSLIEKSGFGLFESNDQAGYFLHGYRR